MSEKELEFTTRLTREDVAGVIEALVEGLKDGHLKIHKSNEVLELEVPRVIDLEVEAKVSHERAKFEIEVSWRTNRAENPDAPDEPAETPGNGRIGAVFAEVEEETSAEFQAKAPKKAKTPVKRAAKTPPAGRSKKKEPGNEQ